MHPCQIESNGLDYLFGLDHRNRRQGRPSGRRGGPLDRVALLGMRAELRRAI